MILAIDTSAGTAVALVDADARALAQASSDDPRGHAETIGTLLTSCLADAGARVSDLTAIAAGMGPGPFTGLRVGIAAARTLALATGLDVLPVLSHDAIALGHAEPVVVATDARRREVFVSVYARPDDLGVPVRTRGPQAVPVADLEIPAGHRLVEATTVSAVAIGVIAARLRTAGRAFPADAAVYVRSPDVTLSAGPKRVTS